MSVSLKSFLRFVFAIVVSVGTAFAGTQALSKGSSIPEGQAPAASAGKSPIPNGFVENAGQWDSRALFYTHGPGVDVWLTKSGITYDFYQMDRYLGSGQSLLNMRDLPKQRGQVVNLRFLGGDPGAKALGIGGGGPKVNFINNSGNSDRASSYNEVQLINLYPGVNLRSYAEGGNPRFDLNVDPGHSVSAIKFQYEGADDVRKQDDGTLLLGTRFGAERIADLNAYQQVQGVRQRVPCKFEIRSDGTVGFKVGHYDKKSELIIDPVVYSTYVGAPGISAAPPLFPNTTFSYGVAIDAFREPYVTGWTRQVNFPTSPGAYNRTVGLVSAYVCKYLSDASGQVFSTIINTGGSATGEFVQLDGQNRPVIVGSTFGGIPVTANAFQPNYPAQAAGGQNSCIFILSPDGSQLVYGSYFGGSTDEILSSARVDPYDNIYLSCLAYSSDMPVSKNAFMKTIPYVGNPYGGFPQWSAGFVAAIHPTASGSAPGGGLRWGTYLGSSQGSVLYGLDIDSRGGVYLSGFTAPGFPTTAGAFQTSPHLTDGFIAKIHNSIVSGLAVGGTTLDYSTLLGGSGTDYAYWNAADSQGNCYVFGSTNSVDFPLTPGAFGSGSNGGNFIAKLSRDGSSLLYATYTNSGCLTRSIAVDSLGFVYVTGSFNYDNNTNGIALRNPDQSTYMGPTTGPPFTPGDLYLQVFNDSGTDLVYGTLWGGNEDEEGEQVIVDADRAAYVVGWSDSFFSTNPASKQYPTTQGVFDTNLFADDTLKGTPIADPNGVLTKFIVRPQPVLAQCIVSPNNLAGTETAQGAIFLSAGASAGGASIHLTSSNANVATITDVNGNPFPSDTLLIAEGASSGNFLVHTNDVVTSTTVNIKSEMEGMQRIAQITVAPWLQSLVIEPFTITGGNQEAARLVFSAPAPAGGLTVSITSSNPKIAFPVDIRTGLPVNQLTVPANLSSAVFNIASNGVDSESKVIFTARIVNPALIAVQTAQLTVEPAHLASLAFNPTVVNGGENTQATVKLNGAAGATPIALNLSTGSGGARLGVPPVVTIPAFANSATFTVQTGATSTNQFNTVTASRSNGEQVSGTIFVDAIAIVSVDLDTDAVLGGTTLNGHVTLSNPAAPGGFTVTVTTSSTTYGPLNGNQASIQATIPAGSVVSNTFTINTPVMNRSAVGDQLVTITASKSTPFGNYSSVSAHLVVRALAVTLTATPSTVIGGIQGTTLQATLSSLALQPNGFQFSLTSDNPNLPVPFNLTVPANTTFGRVTAFPLAVSATTVANVSITLPAIPTPIKKTVQVTINPLTLHVNLAPSSVTGGAVGPNPQGTSIATVSLSVAATQPIPVTLSDTNNKVALIQAPTTVTIPKGGKVATFTINTVPVLTDTAITVRATVPGGAFNTADLEVLAPRVASLTVQNPVVVGGIPTTGTLTLNSGAPYGGLSVPLGVDQPTIVQVPAAVAIGSHEQSATFAITTTAVATDTTVTLSATFPAGTTISTTMVVQAPRQGSLTFTPSDAVGGTTITGKASIGIAAPTGGLPVSLFADPYATGTPYQSIPFYGEPTVFSHGTPTGGNFTITVNGHTTAAIPYNASATQVQTAINALPGVLANCYGTLKGGINIAFVPAGTTPALAVHSSVTGVGASVTLGTANPLVVVIPKGVAFITFPVATRPVARTVGTSVTGTFGQNGPQVSAAITLEPGG